MKTIILFLVVALVIGGSYGVGKIVQSVDLSLYLDGVGEAGRLIMQDGFGGIGDHADELYDKYEEEMLVGGAVWAVLSGYLFDLIGIFVEELTSTVEGVWKINPLLPEYRTEKYVPLIKKYADARPLGEVLAEMEGK